MSKKRKIIIISVIFASILLLIYVYLCREVADFGEYLVKGINENGGAWTDEAKELYEIYINDERAHRDIPFRGPYKTFDPNTQSYLEWRSSWYDTYECGSFFALWCFNKAYVWYRYTSYAYDSTTGESISDSANIPCKLTLMYSEGRWVVIDYYEPP